MALPKFVQAKKTYLKTGITSASTTIRLNRLVDLAGNELTTTDFASIGWITLNPGGEKEEIVKFTAVTQNDDGTADLTVSIRGCLGKSPYGSGGTAYDHSAGTIVIVGNNPQIYDAVLDYIAEVSNQGAAAADETTAGLVEEATVAEIDADTASGSAAKLFITPAKLASSKYGTRLPSANEKSFLTQLYSGLVGVLVPYAGATAPSGWLLCDGDLYNIADYEALALIVKGKYGVNAGTAFTAATTDIITSAGHGLNTGDIIFVSTSDTLPTGLSANTPYYVEKIDTSTFYVSLTDGGGHVDISGTGTGTHKFHIQFKVPDLRSRYPRGAEDAGTFAVDIPAASVDIAAIGTVTLLDIDDTAGTGDYALVCSVAHNLSLGDPVTFATTGTLPGLSAATIYYAIPYTRTAFKVAASYADAIAGTEFGVSGGSGTHTMYSNRFTVSAGHRLKHGQAVVLSTTDADPPAGFTASTTYYVITLDDTHIALASSGANATARTPVRIQDAGTGTHTLTRTMSAASLGSVGGEEEHYLRWSEMPGHIVKNINRYSANSPATPVSVASVGWIVAGDNEIMNVSDPYVYTNYIIKT